MALDRQRSHNGILCREIGALLLFTLEACEHTIILKGRVARLVLLRTYRQLIYGRYKLTRNGALFDQTRLIGNTRA